MATARTKATENLAINDLYVVKTAKKVAGNWNAALSSYNEKYVKKGLELGREFVDELKRNTEEAFEGVVHDGRKVLSMIPALEKMAEEGAKDEEFYLAGALKKARETAAATAREYGQEAMATINQYKGATLSAVKNYRETGAAIYKDTNENLRRALANGKGVLSGVSKGAMEAVAGLAEDGKKLTAQAGITLTTTQAYLS
ncbi:MAG: hypothetical protein JRI97_04240, partial [Deltaproteobacteria bacterium]|nr:hypothetical protein [Deltaproteobacteria bacterium]